MTLRLSTINFMFKYIFGIKTTLLESLRRQNTQFRARFRQTSYKGLVFARGEFLSVVGAQICLKTHFALKQSYYK